ncbi:unnamed protein product [Cylicocyclus nassatus]|uniref:Uncharacterized protein n=1 Tax=Cylicocyclus nassatus TaxID=53992 RepID=A0AA36GEC1_CYLNA|nr:unnamed protein product [Cylicocyclus nassatus]
MVTIGNGGSARQTAWKAELDIRETAREAVRNSSLPTMEDLVRSISPAYDYKKEKIQYLSGRQKVSRRSPVAKDYDSPYEVRQEKEVQHLPFGQVVARGPSLAAAAHGHTALGQLWTSCPAPRKFRQILSEEFSLGSRR